MEVVNNNNNFKEEVTTFKFAHNGSKVLLTDIVEDYEEIKSAFQSKKEISYWPSNVQLDLSEGTYDIFVTEKYYNKWGKRVKDVTIFNEIYDYEINNLGLDNWFNVYTLGIDGGTFMLLSDDVLNHKLNLDIFLEKWMAGQYDDNILKYVQDKKTIGFATPTGFGDGTYDVSIYKDNDNIVGIYISFINDEDGENTGVEKSKLKNDNDYYLSSNDPDDDDDDEDNEENDYDSEEDSEEDSEDGEYEGEYEGDNDGIDENISDNSKNY
jgi:hypothetical protein